jgi:hypothetical protein
MLDPNSAARNLELDPMEWTGRMEFDRADPQGWQIGDTGAHLTIGDSASYPIPDPLVQHLVQVV